MVPNLLSLAELLEYAAAERARTAELTDAAIATMRDAERVWQKVCRDVPAYVGAWAPDTRAPVRHG